MIDSLYDAGKVWNSIPPRSWESIDTVLLPYTDHQMLIKKKYS